MANDQNGHQAPFIDGQSTSNHRIEVCWGHLRKQCMEYWICALSTIEEQGKFVGDFVDKNIAQFCFMPIIQVS